MKRRFFSVVLSAMMLATASMGITASAAETTATTVEIASTTTANESASDTPATENPTDIDVDTLRRYIE